MAWKLCVVVVNCQLKRGVVLHGAMHELRGGWGTETATLEANLDQQLMLLAHDPLFQVSLDIRKTYDSLDREQCLEVLSGYEVGANLTRLLNYYW